LLAGAPHAFGLGRPVLLDRSGLLLAAPAPQNATAPKSIALINLGEA
jgi:hypothetical protein